MERVLEAEGRDTAGGRRLPGEGFKALDDSRVVVAQDRRGSISPAEKSLAQREESAVFAALVDPQGLGERAERATHRGRLAPSSGENPSDSLPEERMLRDEDAEGVGPRPSCVDRVFPTRSGSRRMDSLHHLASTEREAAAGSTGRGGGVVWVVHIGITRSG